MKHYNIITRHGGKPYLVAADELEWDHSDDEISLYHHTEGGDKEKVGGFSNPVGWYVADSAAPPPASAHREQIIDAARRFALPTGFDPDVHTEREIMLAALGDRAPEGSSDEFLFGMLQAIATGYDRQRGT